MRISLPLVVGMLFLLFAGCVSTRKNSFQLGLYDVPEEALPEVRAAGFDVVTGAAKKSFLDAAGKADLKVLATSLVLVPGATRGSVLDQLEQYDRHPALWGWYLIDEPDMLDVPPHKVNAAARFVQRKTQRPGIVTVASGHAAKVYGDECDLLFVDFYPVAWAPLARFAKEMRLASFARGNKPYYAVLQAFDWTHFSDVLGQTNGLRLPTIAEIRCMAYMALALEARGLFFYSHTTRDWRLAESPLWPDLKILLADLRRVAPLFARDPLWWPAELEYHDPARMYNEVHDGAILQRLYHVPKRSGELAAGFYFVVINTTGAPVGYDFRVPFPAAEAIPHNGENVPLPDGWLRRTYAPYEVALFGPITSKPAATLPEHGLFR